MRKINALVNWGGLMPNEQKDESVRRNEDAMKNKSWSQKNNMQVKQSYLKFLIVAVFISSTVFSQQATINVDLKNETGDMTPVWAWFGYDEPNYTYMKDGKKLLTEIAALSPVPVYVRAHSLLVPVMAWRH